MIRIYLKKEDIPDHWEMIEYNDAYFDIETCKHKKISEFGKKFIPLIDGSEWIDKTSIRSKFNNREIGIENISTGCKTLLNIICNPDKIFNIMECGWNAVDEILKLEEGSVYMPYDLITVLENPIQVVKDKKSYIVKDYQEYMKLRSQ